MEELCEFIKKFNENVKDIIVYIAMHLQYHYFDDNEVIFNYGNKGDNFYVILKGRVDILIPHVKEYELTKSEYVEYLCMLNLYNEKELLLNILDKNKRTFAISYIDILNLSYKFQSKYSKPTCSDDIIDKLIPRITDSNEKRKNVQLFEMYRVKTLTQGSYFGDNALDQTDQKRTATVLVYSNSELFSLSKDDYVLSLQEANIRSKKSNISQILSSSIFDSLSPHSKSYYQRFYANLFSVKKIDKGEYVIREGEILTNFYFIKSGRYEMSINKNVLEINELIKYFGGTVEDDRSKYELLYENIKYYNFLKEKKYAKVFFLI